MLIPEEIMLRFKNTYFVIINMCMRLYVYVKVTSNALIEYYFSSVITF